MYSLKTFFLLLLLFFSVTISYSQNYYPAGFPKSKINLWLDASDTLSITSAGGAIAQWKDKANSLLATQSTAAKRPVASVFNNKNIVEFNGTQGLDVADNVLLDPSLGYNLAQIIYIYTDASTTVTDFRNGTYSRNTGNAGTASVNVRYIAADNKYEFGANRNNSNYMVNQVADLRGSWAMVENYTPPTYDFAYYTLNGSATIASTPATYQDYASIATIGNRPTSYANVHWGISETILTGKYLGISGRKILNNYLMWKWGLQSSLLATTLNLYNPSPNSSFKNSLIGIGYESGTDSISATGSNNGLGLANVNNSSGFLHEQGDYLLAADNNLTGTIAIGTNFTRWNKTWFISKTDAGNNGGNINMYFDFTTYNLAASLDTTNYNFYLLFNSTDSNFSSGNNYIIPTSSKQRIAGTIQYGFTVDASNINNGYYTIVYALKTIATSNIPLLTNFTLPTLFFKSPFLNNSFAGNTFNKIYWNIDSLNYNPAYYKIYAGTSANTLVLIDSVNAPITNYTHKNIVNGATYYYVVRAVNSPSKESGNSNIISSIPNQNAAQWLTQPTYNTNTSVLMKAAVLPGNTPFKYYFENVSGSGHTSGWINNPLYIDSLLTYGNTFSYRYKFMDSTIANSESAWSFISSVVLIDSAKGGFADKFSFADNNSIETPYGIGPSLLNPTFIDTTGLRFIKHAPAFGIHPRIYCNPEDSTSIKYRFKNTASGRAIAKYIHANTVLLQIGYTGGGPFNNNANYAKDTLGNIYFANVGAANAKQIYDSLAAGDIGIVNNYNTQWGGNGMKMAYQMAHEAFECWLYKGTIDSITNTSYTLRANKLANAITIWAKKALADVATPLLFDNRDRFGSLQMALIYDYLYDQMTIGQRDTVRMGLAAIALKDSSDLHLSSTPSYTATSNWATFGYEIIPLLAIEGEAGYTIANDNALRTYCRTVFNFLTYGVYSQTGQTYEGIGKNQLNVPLLTALAKRGYSMLGHPSIKAYATKYYPAILQPFGYSMLGTDLLGGTGSTSAAYGGWKHRGPLDIIGLKWIFPNDATIDFLWKNYIQKPLAGSSSSNYSYYYQDFSALGQPGYWNYLFAATYCSDYAATPYLQQAQNVYANNKLYFDSLGGFATLRSSYDTLAATLFFHNRQDLGGHTFSNKNDFVFSSLGRIWIPRLNTNSNAQFFLSCYTGANSGILINGLGASADTTSGSSDDLIAIPGKIVSYTNTNNLIGIAGDAKEAYSYKWKGSFGGFQGDHPDLYAPTFSKVTTTLNSYRYYKYFGFDDVPLYDRLATTDAPYNSAHPYYNRFVKAPYSNGIIQKLYRTIAMITDAKPYVIIADDAQRNSSINNYKWVAQVANDLTVQGININLVDSNFKNDLILKEPAAIGNRRLLVRVLNNTGAVSTTVPVAIDSITNPISGLTANNKLPRLVIESNSVDPKFKILLFAFNNGDSLPITKWNKTHDTLVVINNGSTNSIIFPVDSAGRTNILFSQFNSLALTAQQNNSIVKINWNTTLENGLNTYTIEKSKDSISFTSLATVVAQNIPAANYIANDSTPVVGKNYYRLKIINNAGGISYSSIVSALFTVVTAIPNVGISNHNVLVYPNPTTSGNDIILKYKQTGFQESASIEIVDLQGKIVLIKPVVLINGENKIPINTSGFAVGTYLLKVLKKNSVETISFFVSN